jgi:hypothetical protein
MGPDPSSADANAKPNSRARRFNGSNLGPKSEANALAEYASQKSKNASLATAAKAAWMPLNRPWLIGGRFV